MVQSEVLLACEFIEFLLEKQDLVGRSGNENSFIHKEHLAQILVKNVLEDVRILFFSWDFKVLFRFDVKNRDPERLTLPVKSVDLVELGVVKALYGKIFGVGVVHFDYRMLGNLASSNVKKEMVVGKLFVVKQVYKHDIVIYKHTSDEWIRKVVDWHGVVIQVELTIDVKLIFLYFLLAPGNTTKSPQVEDTIVKISSSKLCTTGVLLNLIHLDVAHFIYTSK